MKKIKRAALLALTAALAITSAGCGGGDEIVDTGSVDYPETISVFVRKSASLFNDMKDYNEVLSFQLLEEATGTHIEWQIPPSSGYDEKFNLMIASGTLPDVIVSGWNSKGVTQYIDDGVLADVSEYVEKYMPNLTAFNKENPEIAREYIHDGGKVYTFPYIRKDKKLNIFTGPVIRTDWLKKLNLSVPTNADELHNVLKAFKTQDPNGNGMADEIPMSVVGTKGDLGLNALMYMFGTTNDFYLENGKVKYGIMEPEFEEALSYIATLYSEGLIDPDYILQDRTSMLSKITNNRVGFSFEYQPTQVMSTMAETDPSFKFEGIPLFVGKDGVKRTLSQAYSQSVLDASAGITTKCENPLGVMKWFDYIYGEEGHKIMNFGKEGVTYTMVDGTPKFTDSIENNTEGLSRSQVWGKNFGTYNSYFPAIQDWNSYGQYLSNYGKEAIETWADGAVTDKNLPALVFDDENKEVLKSKYTPIETYVAEQIDKIILGQVSISKLPEIRAELEKRGIADIIKIYQDACDSYSSKDIGF